MRRAQGLPPDAPQNGFVRAEGGEPPYTEEDKDLQEFNPVRGHLLLREVYGHLPHHNDRMHLAGGVPEDSVWQSHWNQLNVKSYSWYATTPSKVGQRFTAVPAAEWQGVLNWKWNSERPLVFVHVFLTKTLGAHKAREIRARMDHRLELW